MVPSPFKSVDDGLRLTSPSLHDVLYDVMSGFRVHMLPRPVCDTKLGLPNVNGVDGAAEGRRGKLIVMGYSITGHGSP